MRHHDDCVAVLPQAGEDSHDPLRLTGVEPGRGLVEHDDLRPHGDDAGDRQALPFAPPRERPRVGRLPVEETHLAERRVDRLLRSAGGVDVSETERHLVRHRLGKEHGVRILEDKAHVTRELCYRDDSGVESVDGDAAFGRTEQPVEVLDERRLPGPVIPPGDSTISPEAISRSRPPLMAATPPS